MKRNAHFIMTILSVIILSLSSMTDMKANVCERAGNVQVDLSPSGQSSSSVTVSFENFNDYQVTVTATITLANKAGTTKIVKANRVLAPKATQSLKYQCADYGWPQFVPSDCKVSIRVEKCQ